MKQIFRQPDNRIYPVQIPDQIFSDIFLRPAAEQHTMGQQYRHPAILFVHVVNHMLHKRQVRMGLRRQLAHAAVARIIQIFRVRIPFQAIGRIADLDGQLQLIPVSIIDQGITLSTSDCVG